MPRLPLKCVLCVLGVWLACVLNSPAAAEPVYSASTRVEFVAETMSLAPGESVVIALHMRMDPSWHVYWNNPGDSGIPPMIRWDLPPGYSATPIQWPVPERIRMDPLVSYGYEGEIALLTEIQSPLDAPVGTSVTFQAQVDWLACMIECVPGSAPLSITLPVLQQVPAKNPASAGLFSRARADLPRKNNNLWTVTAYFQDRHYVLDLKPNFVMSDEMEEIYFFPDDSSIIDHAAEQVMRKTGDGYELSVLESTLSTAHHTVRLTGILSAEPGWREGGSFSGLQLDVPVMEKSASAAIPSAGRRIPPVVLMAMAFLGGLILNLMPCVLPVLGLKILQFVNHAGGDPRRIWRQGVMFTLGVVSAFLVLAGVLLILQALGRQAGWGFQFQSAAFVAALTVLFYVLALNLWGVFEFQIPGFAGSASGKPDQGKMVSFGNGVLATVVATPCTAPFMGTAIGVALGESPLMVILIFSFLGLGMAFPVLLLSRFPAGLRFLPKPGAWMLTLKMIFGWMLMAAVIWLSLVFVQLEGLPALALVWIGLVLLGIVIWSRGRKRLTGTFTRFLPLTLVLIAFAAFIAGTAAVRTSQEAGSADAIRWQPFDENIVADARRSGKPVFLDFTASWCLTCQVNDRVALNHPEVAAAFKRAGIVAVKADWTRHDERITRALAEFGKSSIPFYVLYPPDTQSAPAVLPEILTPGIVLKAVENLGQTR